MTYTYDSDAPNSYGKGRLATVSSSASTTRVNSYDPLGRVTSSTQTTDGLAYTMTYGYDLADRLTSQTYPSGRVVTTTNDVAGRLLSVSDPGRSYAGSFSYPHSRETRFRHGNGLHETTVLSGPRRQPRWFKLGTGSGLADLWQLENGYGGSTNFAVLKAEAVRGVCTGSTGVPLATKTLPQRS